MTFQSNKCSDAQPDVIQHRAQAAAMRSLNQTLLFQSAVIHFNPPRRQSKSFALCFGHLSQARRPVFRCAVCSANPKYFDLSETFEPTKRAVSATQPGFRNRLQFAVAAKSNLAVGFQTSQKMPAQGTAQLQIFNRPIPAVKTNQVRIKPTLRLPPAAFQRNGRSWFCGRGLYQTRGNLRGRNGHRLSKAK